MGLLVAGEFVGGVGGVQECCGFGCGCKVEEAELLV
jgi:hypothetical protein